MFKPIFLFICLGVNLGVNQKIARRLKQLQLFPQQSHRTTETVPALGDTTTIMHWYFDSSHYTPAAGDLVLDRIFNFKSPTRTVPENFGVLLTSRNIDAHLAHIRADREQYRQSHPEDINEIEAMAREVAKAKRCASLPK